VSALRFCFLTTFYPPYNFGGDGIGIRRLARGLVDRGHHVTVVHDVDAFEFMNGGPPADTDADSGRIEVVPLRSGVGALSPLLTQQFGHPVVNGKRLRRILEEGRFDVVVFNNVSLIGGPGLLSYAGSATTLYLAHEHWLVCPTHVLWRHDQQPCTERQCVRCTLGHGRPVQFWRFTDHLTKQLDHVDAFVAMSRFSRDKHREFGFPREMDVLPYFLPLSEEPGPAPRTRPHARPYFLFVGRLERIKGLDDVIPVFDRYTDADLVVVGDGTHGAHLRQLAAGNPRVQFVGRLPERALHAYYQHAVASIVPSTCYETFGITLIESFRMRTPVIARKIGPFPEIVDKATAGYLFTSSEELEAAMRLLQGNADWRNALGERGYEAYRAHWSDEAVVPQFLDIVASAARRRSLACAQS
jgi:glycosyltransferase involved in cell wall biosynthesis